MGSPSVDWCLWHIFTYSMASIDFMNTVKRWVGLTVQIQTLNIDVYVCLTVNLTCYSRCRLTDLLISHLICYCTNSLLITHIHIMMDTGQVNISTLPWTSQRALQVCPVLFALDVSSYQITLIAICMLINKQMKMSFHISFELIFISLPVGLTCNSSVRVSIVDNKYNLEFLQHPQIIKPSMTFTAQVKTEEKSLALHFGPYFEWIW